MTVNANDVIRTTCRMNLAGVITIENVWQLRFDDLLGDPEIAVLTDIAKIMDDNYGIIDSYFSNQVAFVDITCHNVTTNTPVGVSPWPTLSVGGDSGQVLPPGVAALVNFGTGVVKAVGKKYIGVLGEASNSGGGIVGGLVTDIALFAAAFLGAMSATLGGKTYHAGIIDKHGTFRPFTSIRTSTNFAYQRRRKLGRGV